MIAYDHLDEDYQVKVFDKGVQVSNDTDRYRALVQYRMGDMLVPKIEQTEALESLCEDFIRCAQTGKRPLTDGYNGLRVVQLLEAAQCALEQHSKVILSGTRESVILPRNGIHDDARLEVSKTLL